MLVDRSVKYYRHGMGRPRAFDKAEVLVRLRDPFWSRGFAATSLDDLMSATGLGKGSLYAAFGDKHQLFLEVLEAYCAWRLAELRAVLGRDAGQKPAIERLRSFFRGEGLAPPTELASTRGCLLVNSTTELGDHDEAVQRMARDTFGVIESDLAALLEEAIQDGDLPEDTSPRALARLLMAVSHGMEFQAKTGLPAAQVASVGREAALRLLGGTSPPPPKKRPARSRARP